MSSLGGVGAKGYKLRTDGRRATACVLMFLGSAVFAGAWWIERHQAGER